MNINFNYFSVEEKRDIKKVYAVAQKHLNLPSNLLVNLVLVSPESIQQMNNTYRAVNRVTDVLSFPMLDSLQNLQQECDAFTQQINIGDIYICKQRAIEQANEYGHGIKREMCFLALHGLLHLLGYDHENEQEANIMFALQDEILNKAKIARV